jgi:hypothetical protein
MESTDIQRGNGSWLLWLGIFWLAGALILAALTFMDDFTRWWEAPTILMWEPTLSASSAENFTLAQGFAIAAMLVGGGIPVIGLMTSLVRRKRGVAAVFVISLAALGIAVVRMAPGPFAHRYIDYSFIAPAVCTAPPNSTAGRLWPC